jgi:hypothetical protein
MNVILVLIRDINTGEILIRAATEKGFLLKELRGFKNN